MTAERPSLWRRLSGPVKVGLMFALIAIALSLFGLFRNPDTPTTVRSILIATVISGGTWGLVSWAIATAIVDVEEDVAERGGEPLDE
ncbi:MAG: hypothetical protein M5U01_04840 [Ardenticatenaceae bacterium]|nr:hypothetical protein [Ardenticatenaceae bacterium]